MRQCDRLSDLLPPEQGTQQRLAFLAEASEVLGRSLDMTETLQQLVDLVVPRLGDWCVVDVIEGDELVPASVAHTDPAASSTVWRLRQQCGDDPRYGPGHVALTGEAELIEEIRDEQLVAAARDEQHLALMRALAPASAVVVPLIARGRTLGTMTLVQSSSGRRYRPDDLDFLTDVAHRAAVAVDNAASFAERDRVARTLQQALLPPQLPDPADIEVASFYDAADTTDIGGDFYDVVATPTGWMTMLGDVCGKGVDAAPLSTLARHTGHAAALQHADPTRVLGALNDTFLHRAPDESFCTVVCARLDLGTSPAHLTFATAGHPPPLVRRADGSVDAPLAEGMPLGLFDDPAVAETTTALGRGDLVLCYTDGLCEARRDDGELLDTDGVAAALSDTVGMSASATLSHVHTVAEAWQDGQRDDIAVLALRIP